MPGSSVSGDRSRLILDLCESETSPGSERLLRNGIQLDDLTYPELCAACIGLTRPLLNLGMSTYIDSDHYRFWLWCGELLVPQVRDYPMISEEDRDLGQLLALAVRAAAIGSSVDWGNLWRTTHVNVSELLKKSHVVLVYLGFPLLEGILKKTCGSHVDRTGIIIVPFHLSRPNGSMVTYGQRKGRDRCNSLLDLLLLKDDMAAADLKTGLNYVRKHIGNIGGADGFEVIYEWRNGSLHGSDLYPTVGGILLNLSMLIWLDAVKERFGKLRADALYRINVRAGMPFQDSASFYPPSELAGG